MTFETFPLNNGVSTTLFVFRDEEPFLAENFHLNLSEYQSKQQSCEHEPLAITAGIVHLLLCICKSRLPLQVNRSSYYGSRNPQSFTDTSYQICTFLHLISFVSFALASFYVSDVLSGKGCMPLFNNAAWKTTQHNCDIQRCTYAHLSKRT